MWEMIFTSLLFIDLKPDVRSLCKVKERSWFARSLSDLGAGGIRGGNKKKYIYLYITLSNGSNLSGYTQYMQEKYDRKKSIYFH